MDKLNSRLSHMQIEIISWIKKERYWLSYLLILCLISFAYELFNFTLTVDEEFYAERSGSSLHHGWVTQGRWSMYLLSYLYPINPIVPFAPLFFTLVCSALSFSIIVRLFSAERTIKDYVAAPFFIACPTLYYAYSFNSLNFGIGIGFLAGALAIYLFTSQKGLLKWVVPTLLIAFVIGIYQAFLPWIFTLFCFYAFREIIEDNVTGKKILQSFFSIFILLGSGLALYFLISKGFRILLGLHANEYIDGFVRYQLNMSYFMETFKKILYSMKNHYLGKDDIYDQNISALTILFFVALFSIVYQIIKSKISVLSKLIGLAVVFLIVTSPFALNLINAGVMPTRALLAVPLVLSGFVFLALSSSSKILQLVVILAAISTTFQFVTINNRLAFAGYISWQADQALSLRILNRLDELNDKGITDPRAKKIYALVGNIDRSKYSLIVERQTIGVSFYNWDQGNVHRVLSFMRSMGVDEYQPATLEQQRSIMQFADLMPIWPAAGSVVLKDGISIVKLSNYTNTQLVPLCSEGPPCALCRVLYNPGNGGIRILESDTDLNEKQLVYNLGEKPTETEFVNATYLAENDQITVTASETAPTLLLPQFKDLKESSVLLRLDINSPVETSMSIFYRNPGDAGYTGKNQMQIKLYKGINNLMFSIPGPLLEESLRIDPGYVPGTYQIKKLEMYKQK